MIATATRTCSAVELALLARLQGADALLGLPDPFPGWLAEDVAEAWNAAAAALTKRGILAVSPAGPVIADRVIAALLRTWSGAEAAFIVRRRSGDGPAQEWYYFVRERAVIEQWAPDPATVCLRDRGETAALPACVISAMGLAAQQPAPYAPAELLLSAWQHVLTTRDAEEAARRLEAAGVNRSTATALARALLHATPAAALVGLAPRGLTWDVGATGALAGPDGLWAWRLRRSGAEERVVVAPATGDEVKDLVNRTVRRFVATGTE